VAFGHLSFFFFCGEFRKQNEEKKQQEDNCFSKVLVVDG
jgi:hypothetical protein